MTVSRRKFLSIAPAPALLPLSTRVSDAVASAEPAESDLAVVGCGFFFAPNESGTFSDQVDLMATSGIISLGVAVHRSNMYEHTQIGVNLEVRDPATNNPLFAAAASPCVMPYVDNLAYWDYHMSDVVVALPPGAYNVVGLVFTSDLSVSAEGSHTITIIRKKLMLTEFGFLRDNGGFPEARLDYFLGPPTTLQGFVAHDEAYNGKTLTIKAEILSNSGTVEFSDTLVPILTETTSQKVSKTYAQFPDAWRTLCSGFHQLRLTGSVEDASAIWQSQIGIAMDSPFANPVHPVCQSLVPSRGATSITFQARVPSVAWRGDVNVAPARTIAEPFVPLQRPRFVKIATIPFGCITVDASNVGNEAMANLRNIYPGHRDMNNNAEMANSLGSCGGTTLAVGSHGNIGFFCTGGGQGSSTADQYVSLQNVSHWLFLFRQHLRDRDQGRGRFNLRGNVTAA